jgi:hypothetical protein
MQWEIAQEDALRALPAFYTNLKDGVALRSSPATSPRIRR